MKLWRYADDVLYLVGCGLILVFVYQVAPVYTWLAGGIMCIILAVLIGAAQPRRLE